MQLLRATVIRSGLRNPDPADLPFEFHARIPFYPLADELAEVFDVRRRAVSEIDQEIAVHVRNLGIAELQPPTAPGMPRKNARPPMPAACAACATLRSGTAAPARTRSPSIATPANPRPSRTTTPGTPPARTMRLEPRPTAVTGMSAGNCSSKYARSASSSGMDRTCAGPPTRNQVKS